MNVNELNFEQNVDSMGVFDQALLDASEDLLSTLSLDEDFLKELNNLLLSYRDSEDGQLINSFNQDILSIEKSFANFELLLTNDPNDLKNFFESNKNIDGNKIPNDVIAKLDQKSELNKKFPVTSLELIVNGSLDDGDRDKKISNILQNGVYDMRKSKQINGIEGIDYQEIASKIVGEVHKMAGSKGILLDDEIIIANKMKELSSILGKENNELSDYLIRSGLCGNSEIMNYVIDILDYVIWPAVSLYGIRAFSRMFPGNFISKMVLRLTVFIRRGKPQSMLKYAIIITGLIVAKHGIEMYKNQDVLSNRQKSLVIEEKQKKEGLAHEKFKNNLDVSSIVSMLGDLNPYLPIKIKNLQIKNGNHNFEYTNIKKGLTLVSEDVDLDKEDLITKIGDLYRDAGNLNYARQIFVESIIFNINKRNISQDSCYYIEESDEIYNNYNGISEGLFGDGVIDIIEDLGRETINIISNRYSKYVLKNGLSISFIDSDNGWYKDLIRTLFIVNKIKIRYPHFVKGFKFNFVEEFDKKSLLNFDFSEDILLKLGKEYPEKIIIKKIFCASLIKNYSVENVDGSLTQLSLVDAKVLHKYMEDSDLVSNILSKGSKFMPKKIFTDGNNYVKK